MCDASDDTVEVVLGQRIDENPYIIYYVSHKLNEAQVNYTVTEELLAIVFGFEKLRPYLIGSHVVVFTDHMAFKHMFDKRKQT